MMFDGGPSAVIVTSTSPLCATTNVVFEEAPPTSMVPVNVWVVSGTVGVVTRVADVLLLSQPRRERDQREEHGNRASHGETSYVSLQGTGSSSATIAASQCRESAAT